MGKKNADRKDARFSMEEERFNMNQALDQARLDKLAREERKAGESSPATAMGLTGWNLTNNEFRQAESDLIKDGWPEQGNQGLMLQEEYAQHDKVLAYLEEGTAPSAWNPFGTQIGKGAMSFPLPQTLEDIATLEQGGTTPQALERMLTAAARLERHGDMFDGVKIIRDEKGNPVFLDIGHFGPGDRETRKQLDTHIANQTAGGRNTRIGNSLETYVEGTMAKVSGSAPPPRYRPLTESAEEPPPPPAPEATEAKRPLAERAEAAGRRAAKAVNRAAVLPPHREPGPQTEAERKWGKAGKVGQAGYGFGKGFIGGVLGDDLK